jgi:hypothetical protein
MISLAAHNNIIFILVTGENEIGLATCSTVSTTHASGIMFSFSGIIF